jgi:hypothetical protein
MCMNGLAQLDHFLGTCLHIAISIHSLPSVDNFETCSSGATVSRQNVTRES